MWTRRRLTTYESHWRIYCKTFCRPCSRLTKRKCADTWYSVCSWRNCTCMAHIGQESHSFTCTPSRLSMNGTTQAFCLFSQIQCSFTNSRWMEYWDGQVRWFTRPQMITHSSTNAVGRCLTSLIEIDASTVNRRCESHRDNLGQNYLG